MAVFATLTNQPVDMRKLWPDAGGSNITAIDPPSGSLMRITRSDGFVVEYRSASANLVYTNALPPVLTSGLVTSVFLYDALGTRIATLSNVSVQLNTLFSTAATQGFSAADSISGTVGDDVFVGGGSNDIISGGTGTDTAVFSGNRGQYRVERQADGTTRVTDLRATGLDGVDMLTSIERLQFANINIENPAYGGSLKPAKIGGERLLNPSHTTNDQSQGELATRTDGRFSFAFISDASGPNGQKANFTEALGSTGTTGFDPDRTFLSLGLSGKLQVQSVKMQSEPAVISAGAFSNLQVSDVSTEDQLNPAVVDLENGRSVVVWQSGDTLQGRFLLSSASGIVVSGPQFTIAGSGVSGNVAASVVALDGGAYAVAWQANGIDATEIFLRFFDNNTATSAAIQVNETTAGLQSHASITRLGDAVVVVWEDHSSGTGRIVARIVNDDGSYKSSEFFVDSDLTLLDVEPVVSALNDGRFVVAWIGHDGVSEIIKAQIFNADGNKWCDEFKVNTSSGLNISDLDIGTFVDGRFAVSWTYGGGAENGDSSGAGINLQIFDPRLTGLVFEGSQENERIEGTTFVDLLNGAAGADLLFGRAGNDVLNGGDGTDTLNGGGGRDTMAGGTGSDTYIVDNFLDVVMEDVNAGTDIIKFNLYSDTEANLGRFGSNIEIHDYSLLDSGLVIAMATPLRFMGTAFDDTFVLSNTTSANVDSSALFPTTVDGGAGIDTIDLSGRTRSTIDYSMDLSTGGFISIENILGFQTFGNATLTGNSSSNTLAGSSGNDILDGREGVDTLRGGGGNDIYVVDDLLDVVVESAAGGTVDVVRSGAFSLDAVNYSNVENFELTGSGNFNLTGNGASNVLVGNSGSNTIDGGAGSDTMLGGLGSDTFIIDNLNDEVLEASGEGTSDMVSSSLVSLDLSAKYAHVEHATLVGGLALNLTGSSSGNTLVGNSANNTIDGGGGIDLMIGGEGNDGYVVDVAADSIIEGSTGGTADRVFSSTISLNLVNYSNVENATLTGSAALSLLGNAAANGLTGNSGANSITGFGGADRLLGGLGIDTFIYTSATDSTSAARDLLDDFNAAAQDIINLAAIDANAVGGTANDTFSFIGNAAAFTAAGQVRYQFDVATGRTNVFINRDTNFTTHEMEISLKGNVTLDLADFVL